MIVSDDEDSDADLLHAVWNAARERKLITLEISATYIRGQMKTAQVVRKIDKEITRLVYEPEQVKQQVAILTPPIE